MKSATLAELARRRYLAATPPTKDLDGMLASHGEQKLSRIYELAIRVAIRPSETGFQLQPTMQGRHARIECLRLTKEARKYA